MQNLSILGSTGSIGQSTLSVVDANLDSINVIALTANNNREKLYEQCLHYRPRYAVMKDADEALALEKQLSNEKRQTHQ